MGVYTERVVPRIMNVACGAKQSRPLRERVCAGLSGEVEVVVPDLLKRLPGSRAEPWADDQRRYVPRQATHQLVAGCEHSGDVMLNESVHTPLAHSWLPVSVTVVHAAPKAPLPLPLPLPLPPAASILVGVSSPPHAANETEASSNASAIGFMSQS